MHLVARGATLLLDGSVFKQERACLIDVTFGADLPLPGRGKEIVRDKGAVRVVTVRTGHQPLVDAMMLGLGELRFDVAMTAVTEARFGVH